MSHRIVIAESRRLRKLVKRAIKYSWEDRMVTPGLTRLRRVLTKLEQTTAEEDPPHVCPGCHAFGKEPCAPGCIDAEVEADRRHAIESGDYDRSGHDSDAQGEGVWT